MRSALFGVDRRVSSPPHLGPDHPGHAQCSFAIFTIVGSTWPARQIGHPPMSGGTLADLGGRDLLMRTSRWRWKRRCVAVAVVVFAGCAGAAATPTAAVAGAGDYGPDCVN